MMEKKFAKREVEHIAFLRRGDCPFVNNSVYCEEDIDEIDIENGVLACPYYDCVRGKYGFSALDEILGT